MRSRRMPEDVPFLFISGYPDDIVLDDKRAAAGPLTCGSRSGRRSCSGVIDDIIKAVASDGVVKA